MTPPPPPAAAPGAGMPPPPAPLAARRRQARVWACLVALAFTAMAVTFFSLLPRGELLDVGWTRQARAASGLGAREWRALGAMALGWSGALLALQRCVLRPLAAATKPQLAAPEAVFFASSLVARAALAGMLAAHHFGPGGAAAAAAGDGGHRLPAIALFAAAYATDLVQLYAHKVRGRAA